MCTRYTMAAAEKTAALLLGDDDEGRGVLRQLLVKAEEVTRPGEMAASLCWHHGGAKPCVMRRT